MLSLYLAVLDDQSKEEQFIDVYNIYKRLVYHTAYKIMGDSYLAEDVLQPYDKHQGCVFLHFAKRGSYNNNRILYNTKCIQLLR